MVVGAVPSHHQHLQQHCHRSQWQASVALRKRSPTQCPQSCFRQGAAYSQMLQNVPACRQKYLVVNNGARASHVRPVASQASKSRTQNLAHCFTANMSGVWPKIEQGRLHQNTSVDKLAPA